MMTNTKEDSKFGVVMASDGGYTSYIRTSVRSIRIHNPSLPIDIYTCDRNTDFTDPTDTMTRTRHVSIPTQLGQSLTDKEKLGHAMTRIAKLDAMVGSIYDPVMYLDCDTIALCDIEDITKDLPSHSDNKPVVNLLLRRPSLLTISDIGWLYFKNDSTMSPQQKTDLVNSTFKVNYSTKELLDINCWNGGIIYGSAAGIKTLSTLWKKLYISMLTGKNKDQFIPNDQLCLWIAVNQLKNKISTSEMPLRWNFMPGHAMETVIHQENPILSEIKDCLVGVNILHLAQNKTDPWAKVLYDEVNSSPVNHIKI